MRYLGGKSRLAKRIVAQMPVADVDEVWEPFMGGGAVTAELARVMRAGQRLVASDAFVPLVAMWVEAVHGWVPPDVDEAAYARAKELADTDPAKAFARIGCSFGGNWGSGFARARGRDITGEARRALVAGATALRESAADVSIELRSFFDVAPSALDRRLLIYCDPPYAGTTGYPTGPFDHDRFWHYCREWRRHGALVYVSEFNAPEFAKPIWRIERACGVEGPKKTRKVDTLYEVQP